MGAGASVADEEASSSRFINVQPTVSGHDYSSRDSTTEPTRIAAQPNISTATSQNKPSDGGRNGEGFLLAQNSRNQDELYSAARVAQTKRKQQQTYFDEDVVFETFHHKSGETYTCLYRGGVRFYLDSWHTQEWQEFPMRWYNEGVLVTDTLVRGDNVYSSSTKKSPTPTPHQKHDSSAIRNKAKSSTPANSDDREGFVLHPRKGKLPTYIFEEKRNIHCYYDEGSGRWVKLPLGWELTSNVIKPMVDEVQEILPEWSDRYDVLASLRASNYDIYDSVDTFLQQSEAGEWIVPKNLKNEETKALESKNKRIIELENKLKAMTSQSEEMTKLLTLDKMEKDELIKRNEEYADRIASLETEARMVAIQFESVQQSRPKTARPKTPIVETRIVERNVVDPNIVFALENDAKEMYKIYTALKMSVQQMKSELELHMVEANKALKKMVAADSSQSAEITELRNLYRREATQRKLLYNKLQELRGNIRVFCRCRLDTTTNCCLEFVDGLDVVAFPGGNKKTFSFDKAYPPETKQTQVFGDTLPIITSCVDGYNVCILAYGQTGSGKTHTMIGSEDDPGVNIRSIEELLKVCAQRETVDYQITCSMVEIYNEMLHDLLSTQGKQLELRMHGKNLQIPGIIEMPVSTADDIKVIIELGDKNRAVAATKMNSQRSHMVMMITVQGHDKVSNATSTGVLTLCDLAGSERVSKSEATGQRLVEAAAINKSLSALGQVFGALRSNQLHVPYRNSKLTHILQPSLGGDAKACLFIAVSPDESNIQETISTLQFGANARQIALGQAKQNIKKPG